MYGGVLSTFKDEFSTEDIDEGNVLEGISSQGWKKW
jgi:hypothetical protein